MRANTQQSNPENPKIRKIGVQTITAAFAAVLLCAATAANAQYQGFKRNAQYQGFKSSARLGYSMQMVNHDDLDMGTVGFSGGLGFSIPAGPVVIAPEITLMYRENWGDSDDYWDNHHRYFSTYHEFALSLPVLLKLFPTQSLYLQAGVQVDIPIITFDNSCFSDTQTNCQVYTYERADDLDIPISGTRIPIDLGIPVGIGYMIMPSIGVDFRYVIGLTAAYSNSDEEYHLNSMSLGVTFLF